MIGIIWNITELEKIQDLESDEVKLIRSDEFSIETFSEIDLLVIPTELEHRQKRFIDFFGFTLLRIIRLEYKLTIPIVLLSLMPKEWFIKNYSRPEFQILKTPGHYFFQFPINWNTIFHDNYEGISKNMLNDINSTFFTIEGVIDEEFHDLKNKSFRNFEPFENDEFFFEKTSEAVINTFDKIQTYLDFINENLIIDIRNRLLKDIKTRILQNKDFDGGTIDIKNYIGEVKRLLPSEEKTKTRGRIKTPPWKVLFIDDDIAITKRIQSLFKERNIYCEIVNKGEDAFDILKKDSDNKITVLICDYRLLNEDETWQKWQGYDIMEEVFLNYLNELSFFSLTSFDDLTMIQMQDLHNLKVISRSKDDVIGKSKTGSGFNLFVDRVLEEGNKVFDFRMSQPRAKSWTIGYNKKFDRPLQYYYRMHRLSDDFELSNHKISKDAENFFFIIKNSKHEKINESEADLLPIQESIGIDKEMTLVEFEKLKKFRIKLTGRRIAIALFDLLEMQKGQIYNAMKSGRYRVNLPKENENTINQYFTTYMALSLKRDVPNNLLPEEKKWLKELYKKL